MESTATSEHQSSLLGTMSRAIDEAIHKVIDPIKEALAPEAREGESVNQTVVSEPSLDRAAFANESVVQEAREEPGSLISTASPGVVGLAQSLGPNSSAMEGQSNTAPNLTRFYAEIEDRASREASPIAGFSNAVGISEIDQNVTKTIDGTVEAVSRL